MRSKWSLIRPNCVWRHLWSDPIALEVASDQTKVRSNSPMIRPFRPKWPLIRPSPDHDQFVVRSNFRKDPVISVWEHTGVRSTGSDQKSIWVWTSTWVIGLKIISRLIVLLKIFFLLTIMGECGEFFRIHLLIMHLSNKLITSLPKYEIWHPIRVLDEKLKLICWPLNWTSGKVQLCYILARYS